MAELREWLNRGDLDDDRRAKFLDELAQILLESGQTEAAIAIRRDQELPLVQRLGDEVEIAFALGNLSFALQTGGHTEASIAMLRDRVLPAFDRLRQLPALCLGQIRLASALLQIQRVNEAIDVITKQAIPLATLLNYGDLRSDANFILSACLAHQGRYKEAIGVLESVIASWESQPTGETKLPTAQSQLGHYLTMVGQLDKAGPLLEQAAADLAAQNMVAERTQALYRLARVYELQGQLSRALQVLREQAMPVATAVGDAAALGAIADLVKRLQAALANQHDQLE
jgi:tetratricopeptide (TPR) repeat protein